MTTSKKNICLHRNFVLPIHNSDTTFLKQTIQENHNPSKNSSLHRYFTLPDTTFLKETRYIYKKNHNPSKIVLLPDQINQRLLSPSQKISFFSCLIFTSHFSITHHHIFISHFTENTQVFFLLYVHTTFL